MNNLILELEDIGKHAKEDYSRKEFRHLHSYIKNFNKILRAAKLQLNDIEIDKIEYDASNEYKYEGYEALVHITKLRELISKCEDLIEILEVHCNERTSSVEPKSIPVSPAEHVCMKFTSIIRQLRRNLGQETTYEVQTEADIVYLFNCLLSLYYEVISYEHWSTPSSPSRAKTDLILNNGEIILVIHKVCKDQSDTQLYSELLVSYHKYLKSPPGTKLIYFIYDPEFRILDPVSIQENLTHKSTSNFNVQVFISPTPT